MKQTGLILRMCLGGAICGSFIGIFAGGLLAGLYGAVTGTIALGLDGALLGGSVGGLVGAVLVAALMIHDAGTSEEVKQTVIQIPLPPSETRTVQRSGIAQSEVR